MSKRTFRQSMEHGVEAHQAGRYEEALASYRAALDLNPVDAEAISLAGLALLHLERTEQALPLLHQAVELEPNQSGFRLNLAEGLVQANQHDRALHELQVVTAAEPGNARAWTRAGDVSALLGDEAGAIGAWRRAWSLSPTAAPLASKLAQAMIARRDWGALQRIAAAWTRAHPTSDEAWRVAARAAFEQGRHVAAASAFARVLQVARRPPQISRPMRACVCMRSTSTRRPPRWIRQKRSTLTTPKRWRRVRCCSCTSAASRKRRPIAAAASNGIRNTRPRTPP